MKTCLTTDCGNITEGSTDFCAQCNRRHRKIASERKKESERKEMILSKSKKIYAPPRKISPKREELNKEYAILREQFLRENPKCEIKANEYCSGQSEDVHHSKGRGKFLLDVNTWKSCCRSCHTFIHDHPKEAIQKGWSESRLSTTEPHKI